ncbi:MAG: MBL fold metallo-hydrolase [Burkholderiales bacterium]|nr:MBL fold metallo-hydrolase [Burkholderiales bacterium]
MARLLIARLAQAAFLVVGGWVLAPVAHAQSGVATEAPYPNMPSIPAIGVRTAKYLDVPASAQGPAVDPAKGYRLQNFGSGLYMVTDNQIQSMFLVYDHGVVVMDAPQAYASSLRRAIAEVTDKPVTHLVYSHSHADHIGGAKALGEVPVIIAHDETLRLLKRDADPNRPLPTLTFPERYTLRVGEQVLELSYHGPGHVPGNIFIYAPRQSVLMAIDLVFPGWIPWRRFAVAQDVLEAFARVEEIRTMDWDFIVGGHVTRAGTHADVERQAEFYRDIKQAAATALATTKVGEGMNPLDKGNPWALFDDYIDRVAAQCVNALAPKWSKQLAGFDVFIWDQCYSMEQTLRID